MSYSEDIEIDETGLDVAWLSQPRLMGQYTRRAAEAHLEMDLAKERVELVWAQTSQAILADPKTYGITAERVTEAMVKAAVQVHPDYVAAVTAHLEAKFQSAVADGAVRAFDQRKSALENLVRLHGQSYFAGPVVPRDLREEREKIDRIAQGNVKMARKT